jgi:dipeptidase E
MAIQRQIVAMGGGGFSMEPNNLLLDRYIIGRARRSSPAVCFLPHGTDDATRYSLNFFKAFSELDARPSTLSLFTPHTADLGSYLCEQDIIYVGGGNTKSMLALWREWQLDQLLRTAYQNGTVLAGLSAGANCWFAQCTTDSVPGTLGVLPGLGLLEASFSPHYDSDLQRRPTLHSFLADGKIVSGYAADDGAALLFIDEMFEEAVSSRPNARGYRITEYGGQVIEDRIDTRYLAGQTHA